MAMQSPMLSRHDLEAKIVKRCWEDPAFRKEFTSDPRAAIVKYLSVPVAELPKIMVHEEAAGAWYIVLPPKPSNSAELSDGDLEKVAGGATPTLAITLVVSGAAISGGSAGVSVSAQKTLEKGW